MICKRGRFVIERHKELRDLEVELLSTVRSDVDIEPVLRDICGENWIEEQTRRNTQD